MIDLQELRDNFIPINVAICDDAANIGVGSRIVFWIAGTGRRTAVFDSMGEYFVLRNSSFKFVSVYGVDESKVCKGRIHYRIGTVWTDLGPINSEGHKSTDIPIDKAYKQYTDGCMDDAYMKDFSWEDGGSF